MQINFTPLSKTPIEASNSPMVIPSSRPSVGGAFVPMPVGEKNGDLIYWDPNAGDSGAWVVLAAPSDEGSIIYWNGDGWNFLSPPSGQGLKVLTANGGSLAWTDTQDC